VPEFQREIQTGPATYNEPMRSLIIGGTRNLGPSIVAALLKKEYKVAVFNRGQTQDDLPAEVERLCGDRSDPAQLRAALAGREFELVVDTTLYSGPDAEATADLLKDRVGRYIFLSTGQVYLVRVGVDRPFKETDYPGELMAEPAREDESEHRNWLYGFDKRQAEDVLARAWQAHKFPFTSLRLPMVNSERDHYNRIYGYSLRLQDGGPILIPDGDGLTLRHVYGEDVVQAIVRLARADGGKGQAYNISQDETVLLEEFLRMLAECVQRPLRLARVPRGKLKEAGLLPGCSPFSDPWMSALDNTRSKRELGMAYTPLKEYVTKLVEFFGSMPPRTVAVYEHRAAELSLACG
jgi:nucleoside-diphosphate-sugar epimerase